MSDTREIRMFFKLAVIAPVLVPVACVVIAIADDQWVMFPGALVSLVVYWVLGNFALRGREWARWVLFALMLGIAMLGVVFTFVRLGGGSASVGFNPWVLVIPLFYGLVAAGLAVGARRVRRSC